MSGPPDPPSGDCELFRAMTPEGIHPTGVTGWTCGSPADLADGLFDCFDPDHGQVTESGEDRDGPQKYEHADHLLRSRAAIAMSQLSKNRASTDRAERPGWPGRKSVAHGRPREP